MSRLRGVLGGEDGRAVVGRRRGDAHRRRRRRGARDGRRRAAPDAGANPAAPRPRSARSSRPCSSRAIRTGSRGRRSPGGPAVVLDRRRQRDGQDDDDRQAREPLHGRGPDVLLAAADTFRAAAIDQLLIWADRAGVPGGLACPRRRPGRGRVRRARRGRRPRRRPRHRRHGRPPPHEVEPHGRAREDPPDRRQAAARRRARDALRPRRDDRPERPPPGASLPRGGRADGDRPDEARFDGEGRDRLRDRARSRRPGPVRRGGGAGRRPPAVRPGRVRGRAVRR